MRDEIGQLPFKNQTDLLPVHELAMRLARKAGLPPARQIHFASAVAGICDRAPCIPSTVSFKISRKDNGQFFLEAVIHSSNEIVEMEIDAPASGNEEGEDNFPASEMDKRSEYLEASYQDMKQFTFALSHDLKNSLTNLKLALSLVEEEDMTPVIRSYVHIIHRSAGRLEKTMLSLNQIIALGHSSPAVVKAICPREIFSDVYDEFAESLLKINASVKTDFTAVERINFVEVYLKSIFSNLVSNAIKYSVPGRDPELSVSAFRHDERVILVFEDNGQGIDLQKHGDKIFHPFTRFSGNAEGSGNGLYLIKNMVERNGGMVEVDSTPGKGTTFRFFLREYDVSHC